MMAGPAGEHMKEGALTGHLPPLSPENQAAISIFNKCDGKIEFPNIAYVMVLEHVEDFAGMLDRLYAIAKHQRQVAAARRASMTRNPSAA